MIISSLLPGIITEEYLSEEELQEASAFKRSNFVGVVFNDAMSYQLRFPDSVAMSSIYMESRGKCARFYMYSVRG